MSSQLTENREFISLLLSTSPAQKKALLNTITPSQASVLNEIFYNILNIDHSLSDRKYLKNKIVLIKKLAASKRSIKHRQSLVRKHKLFIIKIFDHFSDQLKQLI